MAIGQSNLCCYYNLGFIGHTEKVLHDPCLSPQEYAPVWLTCLFVWPPSLGGGGGMLPTLQFLKKQLIPLFTYVYWQHSEKQWRLPDSYTLTIIYKDHRWLRWHSVRAVVDYADMIST